MGKQQLIENVLPQLGQMGVSYTIGQGADVVISCEFLDASWNVGSKSVSYQASVYFDEGSSTVFIWEMTKEQGAGFSLGSNSGTSFQSGKTLFRKVKSVQYGPDGKVYEYTLNLGAVPKAFKQTAKAYGWKFKTVLKREKASYPPGYTPGFNINQYQGFQGQPVQQTPPGQQYNTQPSQHQNQSYSGAVPQQQYNNPQGTFYSQENTVKKSGKSGVLYWITFFVIATLTVFLYSDSRVSTLGWVLAAAVFLIVLFLRKSVAGKGCIAGIVLWVIVLLALFFIMSISIETIPAVSSAETAIQSFL